MDEAAPTILILGRSDSFEMGTPSRLRMDHWLLGPSAGGALGELEKKLPTVIGVGALDRFASYRASPYTVSKNVRADRIWASEVSVAARDAISEG